MAIGRIHAQSRCQDSALQQVPRVTRRGGRSERSRRLGAELKWAVGERDVLHRPPRAPQGLRYFSSSHGTPINKKGSVSSRSRWTSKERVNTPKRWTIAPNRKAEGPEKANPALGGILSRRLHAFDGAGRYYLALGHLAFIRSGVRSEDPCNHPVDHT
jgi:hypothetical protein